MRKLATVREVSDIMPIEGADFIELAQVDGWQCIVKKGEFQPGDYGVYFEIDSALKAADDKYEFLRKGGTKMLPLPDGGQREVIRIRTMKMRGNISQGLLLPVDTFREELEAFSSLPVSALAQYEVDLTKILDVLKYERPLPSGGSTRTGRPSGNFPSFVRKTDQNRIQNVFKLVSREDRKKEQFAATLKLHGSSATVAFVTDESYINEKMPIEGDGGQYYVCSRNWALKDDEGCIWWEGARNSGMLDIVRNHHYRTGEHLAVQGELVGPGINGTHEKFDDYTIKVFAIWDIDAQEYLNYDEFVEKCTEMGIWTEMRCPHLGTYELGYFDSVQSYLDYAEKIQSPFTKVPEGAVFHKVHGKHDSFKAISNKFLLKTGD